MAGKLSKSDQPQTKEADDKTRAQLAHLSDTSRYKGFTQGTYVMYDGRRWLVETVAHCKCGRGDRRLRLLDETTGKRTSVDHPHNKPGGHDGV